VVVSKKLFSHKGAQRICQPIDGVWRDVVGTEETYYVLSNTLLFQRQGESFTFFVEVIENRVGSVVISLSNLAKQI
jgi:hypothetical protein